MPTSLLEPEPAAAHGHRLRAGTAARLAGLPVTTLRVWERRYGVAAARTDSGQRLYSPDDVSRLRLLRELNHAGHAIGTIAPLGLEALQALATGTPAPQDPEADEVLRAVAVGRGAASLLGALAGWTLEAAFDDLAQAAAVAPADRRIGLLLVRLPTLQPVAVGQVMALAAATRAAAVLVVYGFGTEASARALGATGVTVRREPVTARELAQCVRSLRTAPTAPTAMPAAEPRWQVEPRRFSDETLARLAAMPSPVACECQRHVTEIVVQLAGFERYSDECTATGPADAALHRRLSQTAGVARTLFERALQQLVDSESERRGGAGEVSE